MSKSVAETAALSMNKNVDLTDDGTSYMSVGSYGKVIVGDTAFEYFNHQKVADYIQIPWSDVDYVTVEVLSGGKRIPRFALHTKTGIDYTFSAKHPHQVLRAVRKYVAPERMVKTVSSAEKLRNWFHGLFRFDRK